MTSEKGGSITQAGNQGFGPFQVLFREAHGAVARSRPVRHHRHLQVADRWDQPPVPTALRQEQGSPWQKRRFPPRGSHQLQAILLMTPGRPALKWGTRPDEANLRELRHEQDSIKYLTWLGGDRIRTCSLQVMSLMSRPIPLPRFFPWSFFPSSHPALLAWPG